MLTPSPDTVTLPPNIPRGADPANFKADVTAIVDDRIRAYDAERRRQDLDVRNADVRQRIMTYGVSGAIGLVMGIGGTLLTQRLRRGGGRGPMKP